MPKEKRNSIWFGEDPTSIELDKCVSQMKMKRAPGEDGFTTELLKFGGKRLRRRVHEVVQEMWELAAMAEEGEGGQE